MGTRNINSIQNPIDMEGINEQYLLQSLANLGQRIGVQGDGVTTKSFTFAELLQMPESYDAAKHVGYVYKTDDGIGFAIKEKATMNFVEGSSIGINSTDGYIEDSSTEITLETAINGIESYGPGAYVVVDEQHNHITVCAKGNYHGETVEYVYEKFDTTNPEYPLVDGIRIREINGTVTMLHSYVEDGVETRTAYVINTAEDIDTVIKRINVDKYITSGRIINVFLYGIFNQVEDINTIPNVSKYFQFFTYDSAHLYRHMKEYYSEITYKCDNVQLRKQIIVALYKLITSTTIADDLYIPLDYKFTYACNSNNEWQIYYSTTDIAVKYMADDIDSGMLLDSGNATGLICYTDKQEKVTLYNYAVEYDNEDNTIVKRVHAYKHYTLPYINAEGYWNINDMDTTVYAKGKDAGNPNIIIVESHKQSHTVVSGAHKETLLENSMLDWTKKVAYTEPIEKINMEDLSVLTLFDYFKVECWVPDMLNVPTYYKDEWYNLLENSIIINIADIDCIDYSNNVNYTIDDVRARYGDHGVITTLWVLNPDSLEFEYLKRQDSDVCAADFNYISNVSNLVRWHIENHVPKSPDHYQFTYLVFDAAYVSLKNNTEDARTYIYPNITNKLSVDYHTSNYNNEFNLTVKYNDIVEGAEENNITDVYQSDGTKYFDTTYNEGTSVTANIVTNALYTYNIGTRKYKINEYIPNYNVPTVDFGEVLTRNQTLLNRLNFLSFNKYGATYYSYIGTSYEANKNVMVIGTGTTNYNMGTETLITDEGRSKFLPQTELDVNFDNTYITGYTYISKDAIVEGDIINYGVNWDRLDIKRGNNVSTYWTTKYTPTGRYMFETTNNYSTVMNSYAGLVNLNTDNSNMFYTTSNAVFQYAKVNNKMFMICTVPELYTADDGSSMGMHHIYLGDGLYIPELLYRLGLEKYVKIDNGKISMPNVAITTDMNLYSHDGVPTVLQTTSTILKDKNLYRYILNSDEKYADSISDFTYGTFNGNILNISYYVATGKLHMQIYEDRPDNRMSYIRKIQTNY